MEHLVAAGSEAESFLYICAGHPRSLEVAIHTLQQDGAAGASFEDLERALWKDPYLAVGSFAHSLSLDCLLPCIVLQHLAMDEVFKGLSDKLVYLNSYQEKQWEIPATNPLWIRAFCSERLKDAGLSPLERSICTHLSDYFNVRVQGSNKAVGGSFETLCALTAYQRNTPTSCHGISCVQGAKEGPNDKRR